MGMPATKRRAPPSVREKSTDGVECQDGNMQRPPGNCDASAPKEAVNVDVELQPLVDIAGQQVGALDDPQI